MMTDITDNEMSLGRGDTTEGSRGGVSVGGGERPAGPATSIGPEAREIDKVRHFSTEDLNQQDTIKVC